MDPVAERIKDLIAELGINNSQMADSIDLPRPILSHILSGRNKPSLLVIQKILSHFKEVNAEWLINGSGNWKIENGYNEHETKISDAKHDLFTNDHKAINPPPTPTEANVPTNNIDEDDPKLKAIQTVNALDSIVHYYTDGTFKVFTPKS